MREADEEREVGGYRLLRLLGSGGMGTVHEAVDAEGRHVALKLLHPHIAHDPQARVRLAREVTLLHRVQGTGVARVLDAEVEDTEAFVVTELVDGPTLEDDVAADGPFGLAELAGLAHGLATPLRAIHAQGIVHRDLKPGNVMLSGAGPVLIDFGIAQVADDVRLTQTGLVTGTPGYLDPEVISGGDPGPAGDWWAWAAVLLFAATGRPPFGRGGMQAVLARVATGRADTEGLPPAVARALLGALDPEPGRRLTPEQVLAGLDAAADDPAAAAEAGAASGAAVAASGSWDGPPVIPPTAALDAAPPAPTIPVGSADEAPTSIHGMPAFPDGTPVAPGPERPVARVDQEPGTRILPAPAPEVPEGAGHSAALPPEYGPRPDWPAGQDLEGFGVPPGPLPAWARAPRRRSFVVLAVGVGISAAAAAFPGVFVLVAVALLALTATTGWAGEARRAARMARGPRRGDDLRMLAGLPWHLLRGVAVVLPGVLLGTAVAAAVWLLMPVLLPVEGLPPGMAEPLRHWAAGFLGLAVAWLTPTGRPAQTGARAWLEVLTPGPGFRMLLVAVFLGYAAIVIGQILLGASPAPTWSPLPITLGP